MKTDWQKRTESLAWLRAHSYTEIGPFIWVRDCWPDVSEYKDAWVAGAQTETHPTPKAALAEWLKSERRSISDDFEIVYTITREQSDAINARFEEIAAKLAAAEAQLDEARAEIEERKRRADLNAQLEELASHFAPRQAAVLLTGYSPSQADAAADRAEHALADIDISDLTEVLRLAVDAGVAKVEHGVELLPHERLARFVRYALKSAIFDACSLACVESKVEHERVELLEGGSCELCGCDLFGPTAEEALCSACAEEMRR